MIRKILALFIAIAAVAVMSGCSTLADARSAKGTGSSREYAASMATNVFAPDWSKEILDKLGEKLKKI